MSRNANDLKVQIGTIGGVPVYRVVAEESVDSLLKSGFTMTDIFEKYDIPQDGTILTPKYIHLLNHGENPTYSCRDKATSY